MKNILSRLIFLLISGIFLFFQSCSSDGTEDLSGNDQILSKISIEKNTCTKINDGVLFYEKGHYFAGEPLSNGFDEFGYNYQSHQFKGTYANLYLGFAGFPPYQGDDEAYLTENPTILNNNYIMTYYWPYRKAEVHQSWNDARWSNKDCDGDGLLDRHFGFENYQGSGAWETFTVVGEYEDENGNTCDYKYKYTYVAPPLDAYQKDGSWYNSDDELIGNVFYYLAEIKEIAHDPCGGLNGVVFKSPLGPGLGKFK
ncbi:hypothetical protein [Namhaeicola litoreus]|uniref:Lipoprotein n=1 Tax=Namhaeicola litoreus TaxID=1052145 RepID=A0ABW3Y7M0_9FLAO